MLDQTDFGHFVGGALRSTDARELRYAAARVSGEVLVGLPARYSLAGYRSPIEDQGAEGSCTGQSASTAAEMAARIAGLPTVALSRRHGYYWARKLAGLAIGVDSGAPLNTAADAALGGLCREQTWPYVAGEYGRTPPAPAELERSQHVYITRHETIFPNNPDRVLALKTTLANNRPVMVGFSVYGDFLLVGQRGVMPATMGGGYRGGHAVVIVGYQDDAAYAGAGYFLADNSWGTRWPAQRAPDPDAALGSFLIPYAAIQNGIVFEARGFVVKQVAPTPPPPGGDRISRADAIRALNALGAV